MSEVFWRVAYSAQRRTEGRGLIGIADLIDPKLAGFTVPLNREQWDELERLARSIQQSQEDDFILLAATPIRET